MILFVLILLLLRLTLKIIVLTRPTVKWFIIKPFMVILPRRIRLTRQTTLIPTRQKLKPVTLKKGCVLRVLLSSRRCRCRPLVQGRLSLINIPVLVTRFITTMIMIIMGMTTGMIIMTTFIAIMIMGIASTIMGMIMGMVIITLIIQLPTGPFFLFPSVTVFPSLVSLSIPLTINHWKLHPELRVLPGLTKVLNVTPPTLVVSVLFLTMMSGKASLKISRRRPVKTLIMIFRGNSLIIVHLRSSLTGARGPAVRSSVRQGNLGDRPHVKVGSRRVQGRFPGPVAV